MSSLITLKRRIGSIRGTRQITKAMELVSASKLRRAQEQARISRDYRTAAYELLARLSAIKDAEEHPLFKRRSVGTRLYICITSNSGLAGAYNANILKLLAQAALQDKKAGIKSQVIAIGSKAAQFVRRTSDIELQAYYPSFSGQPTQAEIIPIVQSVIDQYISGHVDEVVVLYTLSRSGISQVAINMPLLPAQFETAGAAPAATDNMNFEPDLESVIQNVGTRLVELQVWQMVLESLASEHAMRMLAMKNATDNASELIDDYTLEYNTARQAAITQELAEITGGAEALK